MKTLYYEIKIRVPGLYSNSGFVKVETGKEGVKLFGVLTQNVFIGEQKNDMIKFSYFVRNYEKNTFEEMYTFTIMEEDFQLPEEFVILNQDGNEVIINIDNKIESQEIKDKGDRKINEILDVFESES